MIVWTVTASYGPESDIEPLAVVAHTKEAAIEAMDGVVDGLENGENWIVHEPVCQSIQGQPAEVIPPWRTDLFSDEDRDTMLECAMDEIRDCIKDYAFEECDKLELVDCIGYVDDDMETTCDFLKRVRDGQKIIHKGGKHLQFCWRYGLMDKSDLPVTPLGHEYIKRFS